jgi:iron transport multicopper oxidase
LAILGVRAKPNRAAQTTFANGLNTAILRYVGAPATDPTAAVATAPTSTLPLQESALVPLGTNLAAPGQPTPGGANKVWNLAITFTNGQFAINGVPFVNPSVPVLLQILSGAQTPSSLLPTGSIYSISPGDVIELTIPGGTIGAPVCFYDTFSLCFVAHKIS